MHGDKFWMVLVDDTRSCSYRHTTLESARTEAERLLRYYPDNNGKGITILEAVEYGKIEYPPVIWKPTAEGMYQGKEIEGED